MCSDIFNRITHFKAHGQPENYIRSSELSSPVSPKWCPILEIAIGFLLDQSSCSYVIAKQVECNSHQSNRWNSYESYDWGHPKPNSRFRKVRCRKRTKVSHTLCKDVSKQPERSLERSSHHSMLTSELLSLNFDNAKFYLHCHVTSVFCLNNSRK